MLCLMSLSFVFRLMKENNSISMVYIIKILYITEISTFPVSILDKVIKIYTAVVSYTLHTMWKMSLT